MTEVDLRHVALTEIDPGDTTFEIRKFTGSARLEDSFGRFGILDPLWLFEKSGGYAVVDGFSRLRWAKENGIGGLDCRVFAACEPRELWTRRIEKKIFEGEMNPAEKAQIVAVLAGVFGLGEIPGFFLSSLKVAGSPESLRKWVLVSQRGCEMLAPLAAGEISERAAMEIADWDPESSGSVLSLLRTLRCSASIQVEIIERVTEIALREGQTRVAVLAMERVRGIVANEELNHREKTAAVREYFAELRNPRLSSRRKRFQQAMEALGLPHGVRIVPPESFEGGGFHMELSFCRPDELRRIFREVTALVESDRLDSIFEKR